MRTRVTASLRTQAQQVRELHERLAVLDRLNHLLPSLERMNHLMELDSPGRGPFVVPAAERLEADAETMVASMAELHVVVRQLTDRLVRLERQLAARPLDG